MAAVTALQGVVAGYGVLQPRITPTLPSDRDGSLFQRRGGVKAKTERWAEAADDLATDDEEEAEEESAEEKPDPALDHPHRRR